MIEKTKFQPKEKQVLITHGCKTILLNIPEAKEMIANFEEAIKQAEDYVPTVSDNWHKAKKIMSDLYKERLKAKSRIKSDEILTTKKLHENMDEFIELHLRINNIFLYMQSDEAKKIIEDEKEKDEIAKQKLKDVFPIDDDDDEHPFIEDPNYDEDEDEDEDWEFDKKRKKKK